MIAQKTKVYFITNGVFIVILLLALMYFAASSSNYKKVANSCKKQLLEKNEKINKIQSELQKVKSELKIKKEEIAKKDELIEAHKMLISSLRKNSEELEKKYSSMLRAVDEAAKSVKLFKKRAEADEMLLAKYSKVFFLNEHYAPANLSLIPAKYTKSDQALQIKTEVLPYLLAMLEDMEKEGLNPKVISAYRSFYQQAQLKGRYLQVYGQGANRFSADQGYSEHQLGTTVDIVNNEVGLTLDFENTKEFKWLQDNAWRYGFILSYPKNNKYYIYEPWHWRFVGVALAKYLHDNKKYFYDLDQNFIYKYLIDIFDVPPIRI